MIMHPVSKVLRWAFRLTAGLLLATIPAMAQLSPKLRTSDTDFLDLFQRSDSTKVKPEVLTVLDFSGSMDAMMWHPSYYANKDQNNHLPSGYAGSDSTWLRPYVKSHDNNVGPAINFETLELGNGFKACPFPSNGVLIKANGQPVALADVGTQANANKYPANWVSKATHVRITMRHPVTLLTRQLDLPIPYVIFDSPSGAAATSYSTSSVPDPENGNLATKFDDPSYAYVQNADQCGYFGSCSNRGGVGWIGHMVYNRDYLWWLFFGTDVANNPDNPTGTTDTGAYVVPDSTTAAGQAFSNGIPCLTRYQGVKRAVILTWMENQRKVYWAWRFLYSDEQNTLNIDPRNGSQSGTGRNLRIFARATGGNPDPSVRDLQKALPSSGTPLTYALANAYAQLNVKTNSAFDAPHTLDKYVSPQCQTMFVLLFTDGQANDTYPDSDHSAIGSAVPYPKLPPATRCNAALGNRQVQLDGPSSLNPGQKNFNIWTLAGVAAHGADPALAPDTITVASTYPVDGDQALSRFVPFFIKKRGTGGNQTDFTTPRPIQTMTVGVSLAGSFQDVGGGKYALLAAAVAGDPIKVTWNLEQARPYSATNKDTFFFDARDPEALVKNLAAAIGEAVARSERNTTASPSIPFSGVGLANQVYVGQFKPPQTGGPVWSGDFMMFPTKTYELKTIMLDAAGNPLTYLDCTSATWSVARDIFNVASANYGGATGATCGGTSGSGGGGGTTVACAPAALAAPINWSQRKVFTRLAATSSVPEPQLIPFTDQDPGFTALKSSGLLPASAATDQAKKDLINFIRGADLASTSSPLANRNNIMGDIINSVPGVAEYNPAMSFANPLPSNIQSALGNAGAKLRVIFVGTNQGMLHAFCEVSWRNSLGVMTGTVGELWSFLPTDFLPHLDYLTDPNNRHKYAVDGTPYVYHLDIPAANSVAGNGMIDASERAVVAFGLRKGGRSYYALNIQDPTNPTLAWALNPDEASTIPGGRFLAGSAADVANMGFSTSALIPGRMIYRTTELRDVFLLGGGLSTPAVEANFANTPLGRSVIAIDIESGQILQTWNVLALSGLTASAVGPISTGVIPTRVFLNSDLHQRAYFSDLKGSIWAIGSGKVKTSEPMLDFREDSSDLDAWKTNSGSLSLRRIYADTTVNGMISTLPAPFVVGQFPVISASPNNKVAPAAVGIAFVTGNRMNPMDYGYTSATVPSQHRFNMIFDRQDSKITGVDAAPITTIKMNNFTGTTDPNAAALNPSDPSYYLKSNHGYYVNFPARTTGGTTSNPVYFVPKGITDPTVLSYTAFYSYFTPTASDPCSGGSGDTRTYTICNVVNPVTDDATGRCISGERAVWSGVASNFAALGTVAVMQAGMVVPAAAPPSGESTIMSVKTIMGNPTSRYPRVRTWRTVR